MVLKLLIHFLTNNQQLINKIADSKPIRRTAQLVVHFLNRTSSFSGSHQLPTNTKEFSHQIFNAAKKITTNFKNELKQAQDNVKKKQEK